MGNSTIRRMVPLLLALLVCVTFAGFGSPTTEDSGSQTAPGPFGKYDPPITIRTIKRASTTAEFPPGDSTEENVWTREFQDILGINVTYDWIVEDAQYNNRLNLTLASGDLPNVMGVPPSNFIELAHSGQLADLTDVYEEYASDELRAVMDAYPLGMESATIDGKLYAIPQNFYGNIASGHMIWIRTDWLEELNLDPPETMDELEEVALAFMNNGADFGISVSRELFGNMSSLKSWANGYHAYPGHWIRNDEGEIVYGSIQPEMRDFLEVLADWYDRGIISREFGVKDEGAANADMLTGRVGITFGQQWLGWNPFVDLVRNDPTELFRPFPTPSVDGDPVYLQVAWSVQRYFAASADTPNPEALIKLANVYVQRHWYSQSVEEYGKFISGGEFDQQATLSPIFIIDARPEHEIHLRVVQALRDRDPTGLSTRGRAFYDNAMLWIEDRDPAGFGRWSQQADGGSYQAVIPTMDNDLWLSSEIRGADPEAWARNKPVLDKLEAETIVRIIIGDVPISAFDDFVEDWNELGGEAATAEINALYR